MLNRALSLPRYLPADFPKPLIDYPIPLQFASPRGMTHVLFSVDWEKDHGRWRRPDQTVSFDGIDQGTKVDPIV